MASTPNTSTSASSSSWTYPTRTCRYCLEDVPASVSLYPPGLPLSFQRPVVEYKNEDEYGRLIKPCLCRGGMRYVHELCLRRARTESQREGSLWKCHQCGYQFSFNRLTLQKYLGSKPVSGALTIIVMILVMFLLGFIADPILNLYTDPYDTIMRHEDLWERVEVKQVKAVNSGWGQHFIKGLVSMGVLSFARSMLLNPFHWINLRNTGFFGGGRVTGRSTTGRDRALNVSWIMIAFGIVTAFYLFYKWVQAIISRYLQHIGNNIVDTQLPGDDDDLKPPADFKFEESYPDLVRPKSTEAGNGGNGPEPQTSSALHDPDSFNAQQTTANSEPKPGETGSSEEADSRIPNPVSTKADVPQEIPEQRSMAGSWESTAYSSALGNAHAQGWSFRGLQ